MVHQAKASHQIYVEKNIHNLGNNARIREDLKRKNKVFMSMLSIISRKCINLQRNGITWLIPQTKANTEAAENLVIIRVGTKNLILNLNCV